LVGLHFNSTRLLILAGWVRILTRGERQIGPRNWLDNAVLYGFLVNTICYILVWREFGAVVNRLGALFTVLGTYFFLRVLIRSEEDIERVIKVLAVFVIVCAPFILREHFTGHDLFSVVGANELSEMRLGRFRASGPFGHPIIAGTFAVVLVPLFFGLAWYRKRNWPIVALAVPSALAMMFAASSSTPIMSLPAGMGALLFWPLRARMKTVRRVLAGLLIAVQLCMKAPIWFLMAHVSGLLGGSGWHRAMLIDTFVHHFFEWFLIGTNKNGQWSWDTWDVDDAYVGAGISGGLLGFILFLSVIITAYRMVGKARRKAGSGNDARLIWALGASLFANSTAFFGIVYFDQSIIAWFALLAMIQAAASFTSTKCALQRDVATAHISQFDPDPNLVSSTDTAVLVLKHRCGNGPGLPVRVDKSFRIT
jgi:hypothetical protein